MAVVTTLMTHSTQAIWYRTNWYCPYPYIFAEEMPSLRAPYKVMEDIPYGFPKELSKNYEAFAHNFLNALRKKYFSDDETLHNIELDLRSYRSLQLDGHFLGTVFSKNGFSTTANKKCLALSDEMVELSNDCLTKTLIAHALTHFLFEQYKTNDYKHEALKSKRDEQLKTVEALPLTKLSFFALASSAAITTVTIATMHPFLVGLAGVLYLLTAPKKDVTDIANIALQLQEKRDVVAIETLSSIDPNNKSTYVLQLKNLMDKYNQHFNSAQERQDNIKKKYNL